MFFNIGRRSDSSVSEPQAVQTLILPSLEDCKLSSKNIKTHDDASLYARKATHWCKSVFKNVMKTSPQQVSKPNPTPPPTCPLHHVALWDGITYAFANADEAFAAEEARRNATYDAPHQCVAGALVALKSPQDEEVEPVHGSAHIAPALYAGRPLDFVALASIVDLNDPFVTRSAFGTKGRIDVASLAHITYNAPLLITYPLVALKLTSRLPFTSAQPAGVIYLPQKCSEGRDAPSQTESSLALDLQVAPLIFGADRLDSAISTSSRIMVLESMPSDLSLSSGPTPEWFNDLTQPCAPTSPDAWRSPDITPSPTFRPHPRIEFPISAWMLRSLASSSCTPSPSFSSPTPSPSSSSTTSCLSNDELFAHSALSSPTTTTTTTDEEEPDEKDWSRDLDHSLLSSPWNTVTKTLGTDTSAGGGAPNPVLLSVPRAFVAAHFLKDDADTTILETSLVEYPVDEGGEGDFEDWSDMGSIPDEVDPEISLFELYVHEDSEEEFPSWSEMGSIPDETDLDDTAVGPLTHRRNSIPLSVDSWLLDTASSSQSFPSNASLQSGDRLFIPTIVISPATTYDDNDDDDDDDDEDEREDGFPFELDTVDQGWSPELIEGVKSVTQFILDGLVEDEGDIFDDFDASPVDLEAVDDTCADIEGRSQAGSILATTEAEEASGWSQNFTGDLADITRFLLAGLGPEDTIDFDISAVPQDDPTFELKNTIACPTNNDPHHVELIPVKDTMELVSAALTPSWRIEASASSTPLLASTGRYVEMGLGDSTSKKIERRANHPSFLIGKLSLLADMEDELIKKGLGRYI